MVHDILYYHNLPTLLPSCSQINELLPAPLSDAVVFVFCAMTMLRKSALYPLTVDFEDAGTSQTCTAAFVLLRSTKKSKFDIKNGFFVDF